MALLGLDSGVFSEMLTFLAPKDLVAVAGVCKGFNEEVRAVPIMKWARGIHARRSELQTQLALAPRQNNLCSWTRPQFSWFRATMFAGLTGDLPALKTLIAADFPYHPAVAGYAALNGHLAILVWISETRGPSVWSPWVVACAARSGSLECLEFLFETGCSPCAEACFNAGVTGNLDVLKLLRLKKCPWDSKTLVAAAENGHMEFLEYVHSQGCPLHHAAATFAARKGRLGVLEWLYEAGCAANASACLAAAEKGHLECLKFLRGKGCDWDALRLAGEANDKGHLHVTRWVMAQGKRSSGAMPRLGSLVRICGLTFAVHLNGLEGVVVGEGTPGSVIVRFDTLWVAVHVSSKDYSLKLEYVIVLSQ